MGLSGELASGRPANSTPLCLVDMREMGIALVGIRRKLLANLPDMDKMEF